MSEPALHYETIETRARPARVAVLMDIADPDWRHTVVRIIEFFSSIWGGKHGIIVPTDGSTIDPVFWSILEKYSPDYIYWYEKTWDDIRASRPADYAAQLQANIQEYSSDLPSPIGDGEREGIDEILRRSRATSFDLGSELSAELATRLVPFHTEGRFYHLPSRSDVPWPLTGMIDVLPYVGHPRCFVSFQPPPEIDTCWWAAHVGLYSTPFALQIRSVNLMEEICHVPQGVLRQFMQWVVTGEHDQLHERIAAALGDGSRFEPPDRAQAPFEISMAQVALYGSTASQRSEQGRFALVFGDAITDFCMAYCLRRIGHPAVWLPTRWIRSFEEGHATILQECARAAAGSAPRRHHRDIELSACSLSETSTAIAELLDLLRRHAGLGLNSTGAAVRNGIEVAKRASDSPRPYCVDTLNRRNISGPLTGTGRWGLSKARSPLASRSSSPPSTDG